MKESNVSEKFVVDFQTKTGDIVQSIEMVNLQASEEVFNVLKLTPQAEEQTLWGLLVFCKQKSFFYVPSSESMMSSLYRVASNGELPSEQLVCLSDLNDFQVVYTKPRWLFDSKFQFLIKLSFQNKAYQIIVNTQNKADTVYSKF